MPQATPSVQFAGTGLVSQYSEKAVLELPVNLAPSTSFAQGTILGCITSSANDVQTITAPGSGTYTLTVQNPITGKSGSTTALAYNANDATVQAAIQAVLNSTGGGTVAVSSLAATFSGNLAATPVPLMTTTAGSVAHTTTGRSAGTYAAYANGNSDGTQIPVCVLRYACTTDAAGRIVPGTLTTSATTYVIGGMFGESRPDAPAYFGGIFNASDLVGLDSNVFSKSSGWSVFKGTTSSPSQVRKV